MTDYLVRRFIKNNDNIENWEVRTSYGILACIVGMMCNVLLFGIKITLGFIIGSISVTADAFNNLSDVASFILSYVSAKAVQKPKLREKLFGQGRFEYIAAMAVSFLILQVGFTLLQSSSKKILKPEIVKCNPILLVILATAILVKLWLVLFYRKLGKHLNSSVMKTIAADSLSDLIITSITVISVVISSQTKFHTDAYMGLLVSIFVMLAGFRIAKKTLVPLLGQAVESKLCQGITDIVKEHAEIVGTHDLMIHSFGITNRMATIHVEVPNDINLEKTREIANQIEKEVLEKLEVSLLIYMEPIEINETMVLDNKDMVTGIVRELEPGASIHDFRLMNGEMQINLIFNLIIPASYSEEEEHNLLFCIMEEIRKQDSRYECAITLEKGFANEE